MQTSVQQPLFARAILKPSRDLNELQLVTVVAAKIPNKLANKLIRTLGAQLPIPALKHLKRVRKVDSNPDHLDIILCPPIGEQETEIGAVNSHASMNAGEAQLGAGSPTAFTANASMLPPEVAVIVTEHSLELFLVQVPGTAAQTRSQWEAWTLHWPMAYKVPDGKAPPSGEELLASEADQAYFEKHMTAVLCAASKASSCNVAIIIDPVSKKVIAEGLDCRHTHPLDHAAMVAVRRASQRDLALWPAEASPRPPTQQASSSQEPSDSNRQGSLEEASVRKRQKLASDGAHEAGNGECGQSKPGSDTQDMTEGSGAAGVSVLPRPYMCTGYDCFMMYEPCIMCAMALVHSRLARVIYCHADTAGGALGGRQHLMKQRSLNHHYQAFYMPVISCEDS